MKDIQELMNFGVIVIDKPSGPTSFSVTEYVRRSLGVSKASHMGTLDPKVTGVLPLLLGRACRLAGYIIGSDKTYVGILHTHKEQNIDKLQKTIDGHFVGKIKQTPPHKSAVKREERERTVYSFTLMEESETGKDFLFSCKVEGGTYIRKLCSDLGEMIGGAHMGELRRTQAGIFDEQKITSLYDFEEALALYKKRDEQKLKAMLIDATEVIKKILPSYKANEQSVSMLLKGKPLRATDLNEELALNDGEYFSLFSGSTFIGVYRKCNEGNVIARPEFVRN